MCNTESVICARFVWICFVLLVVYRGSVASTWYRYSSRPQPRPLTPPTGSPESGRQTETPKLENADVVKDDTSGDRLLECRNWEGRPVAEGSQYFPNDDFCHSCVCHAGFPVMCTSVLCSAPDCQFFEKVIGECCTYHCIEPPDHGEHTPNNRTATHPPRKETPSSGDSANLGLRLLASTITCFLVLALLLFMVHRLRQRRMLIMMRRLNAERSEDEAYMSPFDQLDLGMDFTPYDEPPPPYSPPKPMSIPTGEAPPPYQESVAMFNNNNNVNNNTLNNNNDTTVLPSDDTLQQVTTSAVDRPLQQTAGQTEDLLTTETTDDQYGLSISVAALNSDQSDVVVRLQSNIPELEDNSSCLQPTFPRSTGRRVPNNKDGTRRGSRELGNGDNVPSSSAEANVLAWAQSTVPGSPQRNNGLNQFSYRPERRAYSVGGDNRMDGNVSSDEQANRSKRCRSAIDETRTKVNDDVSNYNLNIPEQQQQKQPLSAYPSSVQRASVIQSGDADTIQHPTANDTVRSDSVTSQLSQFSVCSETGERRQAMSGSSHCRRVGNDSGDPWIRREVGRRDVPVMSDIHDENYNFNNSNVSNLSPRYSAVVDNSVNEASGQCVAARHVICHQPSSTAVVHDNHANPQPPVVPQGPCVRRLKPKKPRPHSNPGVIDTHGCLVTDDTRRRRRSAGRDDLRDASFTHYGFIDRPLFPHYPLLAQLAGETCAAAQSSPQALLREAATLGRNQEYMPTTTSEKKARRKKHRSRNVAKELNGNSYVACKSAEKTAAQQYNNVSTQPHTNGVCNTQDFPTCQ